MHVKYVVVLIPVLLEINNCMEVTVQRVNLTYANSKYVDYAKFYVKRFGRKSPYYINVEGTTRHTWNNNVTLHFVFFEYLHNEYRRSFVEVHFKFCNMINGDPYLGGMLFSHGVTCPSPPREYKLLNMTIPVENFPNVFPLENCKVEIEITVTSTAESIAKAHAYALIKTKNKKM